MESAIIANNALTSYHRASERRVHVYPWHGSSIPTSNYPLAKEVDTFHQGWNHQGRDDYGVASHLVEGPSNNDHTRSGGEPAFHP